MGHKIARKRGCESTMPGSRAAPHALSTCDFAFNRSVCSLCVRKSYATYLRHDWRRHSHLSPIAFANLFHVYALLCGASPPLYLRLPRRRPTVRSRCPAIPIMDVTRLNFMSIWSLHEGPCISTFWQTAYLRFCSRPYYC
jgi:hypothetical protein